MIGRRIDYNQVDSKNYPYPALQPSEYGKDSNGNWWCIPPSSANEEGFYLLANLKSHKVTENIDGTITVEPSILVSDHFHSWHGFLTNGIWKEC